MKQYIEIQRDIDKANESRKSVEPIRSVHGLFDQEFVSIGSLYAAVWYYLL